MLALACVGGVICLNTMSNIQELQNSHNEYLAKQKHLAENSDDPKEREIARDLYKILTGEESSKSLLEKKEQEEISRWKNYLLKEKITTDTPITCKGCGYKRYFYKEYGFANHICPECRKEYAITNNDSQYTPNIVPRSERIWSMLFGIPLLIYTFGVMYYPSLMLLPMRGGHSIMVSGLAKIPGTTALLCLVVFLASYIVDHIDKRHNEIMYKSIRFWSIVMYFVLTFIAVSTQAWQFGI